MDVCPPPRRGLESAYEGHHDPAPARPPTTLRIADTPEVARVRSSMIALEVDGRIYRVEFWPDRSWDSVPAPERPPASRAHSGDGWFAITPITPSRPG